MNGERYQVVVVGGGLVGAATALALGRRGLRVALVERHPVKPPDMTLDTRIYAISPASRDFLATLGAWPRLDAARVQPVYRMDIAGDGRGALRLDAYEAGTAQLAHIVESGRLQQALWQAIDAAGEIDLECPATIAAFERDGDDIRLTLGDGRALVTQLLVGADGANSPVRDWAGLAARVTPYGQYGVVASFECARPHRGTALQWFFGGDVLAWLPLPGTRVSMVWSTQAAHADALLALDPAELAAAVQAAGHDALGALRPLSPAAAFPLQRLRAEALCAPGVALVGDAAHGVHPLAGQGVNLGFGDADALAAALAAQPRAHCGDLRVLRAYARSRAEPVARMQMLTHGLHHLFADARGGWLRNAGMSVVDSLPPLKTALVREAMS